jgi:hypothetical protein
MIQSMGMSFIIPDTARRTAVFQNPELPGSPNPRGDSPNKTGKFPDKHCQSDAEGYFRRVNGAALMRTAATASYAAQLGPFVIGNWTSGGTRFVGDLVELLVYDRALIESERRAVEEYLRQRAGVHGL